MKEVRFWSQGFVALLSTNRLISVSRYDEPRPRLLADPSSLIQDGAIHSWTLIPPAYTLSRHVEVLLSTGNTIVVVADDHQARQVLHQAVEHLRGKVAV